MRRRHPDTRKILRQTLAGAALLCALAVQAADPVTDALGALTEANQAAARSQQKIDRLADETRQLRETQRQAQARLEQMRPYLADLQQQVAAQEQELSALQQRIAAAGRGQFDIAPQLKQMTAALASFVAGDIPYIPQERRQRVARVQALIESGEQSLAQQLRAVLEVYQAEVQVGQTLEVYPGELKFDGRMQPVEFLRVGRVLLFYLDQAGTHQGYWDAAARRWQALSAAERPALAGALAMVRGETPPALLALPTPVMAVRP